MRLVIRPTLIKYTYICNSTRILFIIILNMDYNNNYFLINYSRAPQVLNVWRHFACVDLPTVKYIEEIT